MTALSFFQQYSERENHLTNNTLLMLRHVCNNSVEKFNSLIYELLGDELIQFGLEFNQQVGMPPDSVIDGHILQQGIDMYIETKIEDNLGDDQVYRYIDRIATNTNVNVSSRVLIGLTGSRINEERINAIQKYAEDKKVGFYNVTFPNLLECLEAVCENDRSTLADIVNDYADYLRNNKIIKDDLMQIYSCPYTIERAVDHATYTVQKPTSARANVRVIGFYHNKCVSHVGIIKAIVQGVYDSNESVLKNLHNPRGKDCIDDTVKQRIETINQETDEFHDKLTTYYVLEEMRSTNFVKTTKYGIQKSKIFNLKDLLDDYVNGQTDIDRIANQLTVKEW